MDDFERWGNATDVLPDTGGLARAARKLNAHVRRAAAPEPWVQTGRTRQTTVAGEAVTLYEYRQGRNTVWDSRDEPTLEPRDPSKPNAPVMPKRRAAW